MKKIKSFFMPIIMALNLSPSIIVVALVSRLTFKVFLLKVKSMAGQLIANTLLFPGLDPTPADFKIEVDKLDSLETKEKNILAQLKANTQAKLAQKKVVNDIINGKYCNQIQNISGITVDNIRLAGFDIKNLNDQQPDVSVFNSKPTIEEIDADHHLMHTLHVHNSVSGLNAIPHDAKRLDIYMFFGDTAPTDLKTMIYAGSATKGKFTYHFDPADYGKTVWYIVVYVPRKKGAMGELSGSLKKQVS